MYVTLHLLALNIICHFADQVVSLHKSSRSLSLSYVTADSAKYLCIVCKL